MKIVVDENIAYAKEAFGKYGTVKLLPGRKIKNQDLIDADALIVRSVTKVDENLLKKTGIKFVGTATIGTDHIDLNYLKEMGINFTSAQGCNANAVAEYVLSAIIALSIEHHIDLTSKSIGIIGVGNIGSKVEQISKVLGLNVILNDPPLERETCDKKYKPLEEALSADIITFHVPYIKEGPYKTVHLLNENNNGLIKPGSILINASRGIVVDNNALLERLKKDKIYTVLDVWENEPFINKELLQFVDIATPHIAGYSLEGKFNGTTMVLSEFVKCFNLNDKSDLILDAPDNNIIDLKLCNNLFEALQKIVEIIYPIKEDDKDLRNILEMKEDDIAEYFDRLRKKYKLRREFNNYYFCNAKEELKEKLKCLRLKEL